MQGDGLKLTFAELEDCEREKKVVSDVLQIKWKVMYRSGTRWSSIVRQETEYSDSKDPLQFHALNK